MGRDRPKLRCLVAPVTHDGRARGKPLLVELADAECLWREHAWAVLGPDPLDEIDLATWEREQMPSPRST